jgi:hypothetical protein
MSTPVKELITQNIEAAINAVTEANGFNQDLTAIRSKRIDFSDVSPKDKLVLIAMEAPEKVEPAGTGTEHYKQKYTLEAFVINSDKSIESIEIRENQVYADIHRKLMEDIFRDGNALNTTVGPPEPFDDGKGLTGIDISVEVEYRTVYGDPYTAA